MFLNDPFTAFSLLYPHGIFIAFSVTFNSLFLASLMLYWMVQFERIWKENDQRVSHVMYWWKIILGILVFCFFEASGCLLAFEYLEDPSSVPDDDYPNLYLVFWWIGFGVCALVYSYLIFVSIMIIKNWRNRLQRHKTFFIFSVTFAAAMAGLIFSQNFQWYSLEGIKLLMMVVLSNIYVYIILFLYSLSGSGNRELATLKKQDKLADAAYKHLDVNVNFDLDDDELEEPVDQKYLDWEEKHRQSTAKEKKEAGKTHPPNPFSQKEVVTKNPGFDSEIANELAEAKMPDYGDELAELEENHFGNS